MIDLETIRNAISGIFARAVSFAPTLLVALVVLVLGWFVSRLLARFIERLSERINLEGILSRAGLMDGLKRAGIGRSPGQILGLLIFWIVFLNFLLVALEMLGLAAAVDPLRGFIAYLPSLLAGLILMILGSLLAQFVGQIAQAALASMGVEFHEALGRVVRVLLLVIVVILVVEQLGVDTTLLNEVFITLLTLAFAGLALAFGLGGRDVARNVLAGYYAREVFAAGDRVEIDGQVGEIEAIGTINTELGLEGERLVIPNARLTDGTVRLKN